MVNEHSKLINKLFKEEKWLEAREFLLEWLKENPDSHWLLTRIATTYYQENKYDIALKYVEQALKIAPQCPLVLWNYAETLYMVDKYVDAANVCNKLIRRGVKNIAYGDCGEGLRWARSLINDCRYGLSLSYASLGKFNMAQKYIKKHIANRNHNTPSVYNLREVKKDLVIILNGKDPRIDY